MQDYMMRNGVGVVIIGVAGLWQSSQTMACLVMSFKCSDSAAAMEVWVLVFVTLLFLLLLAMRLDL